MKPKILITGFKPFTGVPNPSWEVAQRAANLDLPYAEIVCEEIQVLWHDAEVTENNERISNKSTWNMIQDAVEKHQPDCLISVGQADRLRLECVGRNEAYAYVDNAGNYYKSEQQGKAPGPDTSVLLNEGQPATIDSTFVDNIDGFIREYNANRGDKFELFYSDNAEAYLCNLALYKSLDKYSATIPRIGFIHTTFGDNSIDGAVLVIQMIAERLYGQTA